MEKNQSAIPKVFWVIAIFALLWNMVGVFMFLSEMFVSFEDIAAMEPEKQELFLDNSLIQKIAYALGVFGGLVGSIGLLLRKSWCIPFFLASLIGVVLQLILGLTMTNALEVLGITGLVLPAVVIMIAAFLFWFSRVNKTRGIVI